MKKSNKKIPKTHLPKFYPGGRADDIRPPVDNNMYGSASTERDMMGPTQDMGVGTQNIYNQGRKSKINAGQYAQYGQAAMGLGTQLAANQSLTGEYKQEANNKAISGAVDSTLSTVTPWYGYAKAGSDIGRSMIQRDENGEPVGKMNKQLDAVMKPQHQMAIDDASKGNYGLAVAEMLLPGIGYESRSNSLGLGKGINRMFKSDNDSNYQYAMGGMNKYPGGGMGEGNGQVELDENSIAPNGQFTQFNELDHNQQDPNQPNASLAAGEKVFSAKLKPTGSKKSFADLNKSNNTNREDKLFSKGNLDPKSEVSLKLTMMAKMKNSDVLFAMQEQLKKDKVAAYAKKMGVELPPMDNEQMEPQGKMAMGGVQLPYYNTDNAGNPIYAMGGGYPAMTNPYNNFRGSIPMYPDGGVNAQGLTKPQYEQAQRDSSVIYKSGLASTPNWQFPGFTESSAREGLRTNPRSPAIKTVTGQQYGSDAGVNMMDSEASNFSNFKPTMVPWKEYIPATEKSGVAIENKPLEKPVSSPNWGSTTILKDGRHLRAYPDGHTEIVGNPRKVVNVGNLEKKKYGGQMPKYEGGGTFVNGVWVPYQSSYKPGTMGYNDSMNSPQNPSNDSLQSSYGPSVLPWNRTNDSNQGPNGASEKYVAQNPTQQFQEATTSSLPNITQTNPNSKNFDWGNLAMNVGNFAAQNAGNIYNLSRYNKPEETKFKQTTGKYMDPTKAIAGENYIYRQTKNTAPGLTGGNAGATMALLFANKANTATRIGRLRETYDNANAQIANQVNQYNTGIANQEIIANEQNRARARSGTGEAIGDTAKSFAQMQLDNKKGATDEKTLAMYKEYYNNPQFRAALKKAGYDV